MIMNCLGSLFSSEEKAHPRARVELRGPNGKQLLRLQQAILARVGADRLTLSLFETAGQDMQVLLYKKSQSYQLYKGSPEVNLEELAINIESSL